MLVVTNPDVSFHKPMLCSRLGLKNELPKFQKPFIYDLPQVRDKAQQKIWSDLSSYIHTG